MDQQTARTNLAQLIEKYQRLPFKTLSEAEVVQQFIEPLLQTVLGWDIQSIERFRKELNTTAGRPDITLIPEQTGVIFVEAKKFGVIKELAHARRTVVGTLTPGQMALPGMSVDRTAEEQQAINYAFENNGTWAILTNFEKLRLFNARRDWLVLSFETPGDYLASFDYLWQLSYDEVVSGSLDRLSSQRHREDVDQNYLAFINEWREKLAQDIVAQPEVNAWVFHADGTINLPLLRAVVQRFLDRLVVIRFAEDHLVIPPGTLYNLYALTIRHEYTFTLDEFIDRFFARFDERHNSALFAPGLVDDARFSDAVLAPLVQKLYEARYRAMSADILGNTYEQYLGKALVFQDGSVVTRDNLETRKKQGSYYTPQVIVRHIVDNSLGRYLYGTQNGRSDGTPIEGETRKTSREIKTLRVLDSACGSGSFLIYAYYVLAEFYQAETERLNQSITRTIKDLAASGKDRVDIEIAVAADRAEINRIRDYSTIILEQHIYGTDLDPQAAEIAVVNLIMRAMEGQSSKKRLPLILNQNIKVGNGLIGIHPSDPQLASYAPQLADLRRMRLELITTPHTDPRHDTLITDIEAQTQALYTALAAPFAAHFTNLERVRPFHWGIEFPEVFFDEQGQQLSEGGFAIIFGNPPWEILKPDLREFYTQFDDRIESKLKRDQVEQRIEELDKEDPSRRSLYELQTQSIEQTAAWVRQSPDYQRQGKGDTATHKLFIERMYSLLQTGGRLGYVVPSGIYTDLGTKDLRELLLNEGNIQYLYSFSNERFFFPGVHHSFKFVLLGVQKGRSTDGFWAAFRFNPRVAVSPDALPAFLADPANLIFVRRESLAKFSPDSLSVMEFQSAHDYEVAEKIYDEHPLLGEDKGWKIRLNNEFHMTNDRHLFNTHGGKVTIYNGRMIYQYDAAYAPAEFWVSDGKYGLIPEITRKQIDEYRVGFRRIAPTTNERTLIAAIVPRLTLSDTVAILDTPELTLYITAMFNSFCLDYILRMKIATTVNMFYIHQLPVPRLTAGNPYFDALVDRAVRLTCTRPEFADLWQSVTGQQWDAAQAATDPAARQMLRDEIDVLVAHLYGISRSDFDHILKTFPLVFPDTPAGDAKRQNLLSLYSNWQTQVQGWPRE